MIKANKAPLLSVFSKRKPFVIPNYQRAYVWGKKQHEELWEDIYGAFHRDDSEYFLGNIILSSTWRNPTEYDVIDGQQRLTTITILFKELHKLARLDDLDGVINIYNSRLKNGEKQFICRKLKLPIGLNGASEFFANKIKTFCETDDGLVDRLLLDGFIDYLLDNVHILIIEVLEADREMAKEEAKKMFFNLNNRGVR